MPLFIYSLEKGNDVIQLWTTKNYYWYLKQEICCAYPVAAVKWDPELPRVLHVVCRSMLLIFSVVYSIQTGTLQYL